MSTSRLRHFGIRGLRKVKHLFGRARPRTSTQVRKAFLFEALEPRQLLSAVLAGPEFLVNTFITNAQVTFFESQQAVAADADGDFVVTWSSFGQDSGFTWGVYAQRYDAAGVTLGSEFLVNTFCGTGTLHD